MPASSYMPARCHSGDTDTDHQPGGQIHLPANQIYRRTWTSHVRGFDFSNALPVGIHPKWISHVEWSWNECDPKLFFSNPQPQLCKCLFNSSSASTELTSIWGFSQGRKTNGKKTGWYQSPTCMQENCFSLIPSWRWSHLYELLLQQKPSTNLHKTCLALCLLVCLQKCNFSGREQKENGLIGWNQH